MPISITYIAIAVLTAMGLDNAEQVVESALIVIVAGIALYGRYRAMGLTWYGKRK